MLGAPIAHSLSPVLHRAGYRALGLVGWSYEAIECDEAGLPALLGSLGPDWAGLSLTMPLKRAVLPWLDHAEPLVTEVGGANTVIFAAGRQGYNTDVPGMITALAQAGVTTVPAALVLGAGATAAAALAALRGLGVPQATVAVRDPATAGPLLAVAQRLGIAVRLTRFGEAGGSEAGGSEAEGSEARDSEARDSEARGRGALPLLISTVPAGAADRYAQLIRAGALAPAAVLDVVYHPWPTRLASEALAAGAAVVGGFDLLLHQAVRQFELMTGQDAPTEVMRAAGLAALERRSASEPA